MLLAFWRCTEHICEPHRTEPNQVEQRQNRPCCFIALHSKSNIYVCVYKSAQECARMKTRMSHWRRMCDGTMSTMYPTFISTHSGYLEYIHNVHIHVKHNAVHNALGRRCLFDLNLRANRGHSQMKIDMEMLSLMICFLCLFLSFLPSFLIFQFYIHTISSPFHFTHQPKNIYFLWAIYIFASVTIIDLIVIAQQLHTSQQFQMGKGKEEWDERECKRD